MKLGEITVLYAVYHVKNDRSFSGSEIVIITKLRELFAYKALVGT